jgi:biopolymer transport protein ExbD
MRRWRARRAQRAAPAELEVTTFMNLMVVLVPFLLVMAVFSRITVHELNLPSADSAQVADAPALSLEVIVRANRIDLGDRGRLLRSIGNGDKGYDLQSLADALADIKLQFPDITQATILLEPDIAYEHLVNVMDTVRVQPALQGAQALHAELFPDISVGEAPRARRSS